MATISSAGLSYKPATKKLIKPKTVTTPGMAVPHTTPGSPAAIGSVAPPAPAVPNFTGDSTYFGRLAQISAARDPALAQLQLDQDQDTENTHQYQAQLAVKSLDHQSGSMANAAKAGLADSGYNAQAVKDIITDTTTQQLGADTAWRQRTNQRGAQRAGLIAQYGYGDDYGAEGIAARGEGEQRMLDNYTPPGAVAKKSSNPDYPNLNAQGQAYKVVSQGGKTVHVYPDGRKVVVR